MPSNLTIHFKDAKTKGSRYVGLSCLGFRFGESHAVYHFSLTTFSNFEYFIYNWKTSSACGSAVRLQRSVKFHSFNMEAWFVNVLDIPYSRSSSGESIRGGKFSCLI